MESKVAHLVAVAEEAAATFREFEENHRGKLHEGDADRQRKVDRNRVMAEKLEAAIGDLV